MQKVFETNAQTIFDDMNPKLKNSLGIEDIDDLNTLIKNTNSELYKFIETK